MLIVCFFYKMRASMALQPVWISAISATITHQSISPHDIIVNKKLESCSCLLLHISKYLCYFPPYDSSSILLNNIPKSLFLSLNLNKMKPKRSPSSLVKGRAKTESLNFLAKVLNLIDS